MPDFYDVLGVKPNARPEAVSAAYRKLAKRYHPDLHSGNAIFQQKFIEATEAYAVLSDKEARAEYDKTRELPPAPVDRFTSQQANLYRENPYKDVRFVYHNDTRPDTPDWQLMALIVLRSPVTYCVIIVVLMLLGLKELMAGLHHPATH